MKYSSTTRLINIIVFALLAFGFGWLGIYFGGLVAPFLWTGLGPVSTPQNMGWGLIAMLGIFGLSGLIITGYGLILSVLSLLRGNDDALVRRSFSCYCATGYLLALFCLFNAAWLYRLTTTNIGFNEFGFSIVVYIILFLASVIITNIPVIRMYGESEELNKIMCILSGTLAAVACASTLVFGLSLFVLMGANSVYQQAIGSRDFAIGALFSLVIFAFSFLALLGYKRADKANAIRTGNGFLFEGATLLSGVAIIVAGVVEWFGQNIKNPEVSLVSKARLVNNPNYLDFCVLSWILGSVLVLFSFYLIYSTIKSSKQAAEQR